MSPIMSSQGMALATAMAAVSGTVILLAFRLQKSVDQITTQFYLDQHLNPHNSHPVLRSCISSVGKRRENRKKKRVHFAEDVVEPRGNGEKFRKQFDLRNYKTTSSQPPSKLKKIGGGGGGAEVKVRGMPANRVALYNGILRDRVVHRLADSH